MLGGTEVETDLGAVDVGPAEVVAGIELVPVDVGNPHAVVLGDPDEVTTLGPLLETHPRFPERTNVQVARVDGPGHVTARVWERGVGETSASGTSAVAVAAATHGEGEVVVSFPGGDLLVRLEDGRATLIGPAERLAGLDGDRVRAQGVVQARLQVGRRAPLPDDERSRHAVPPCGEVLRPHPRDDDGAGRHMAAVLDGLRARSRR